MGLGEAFGESQPQPGTLIALEGRESSGQPVFGHALAGIGAADLYEGMRLGFCCGMMPCLVPCRGFQADGPLIGDPEGIVQQVLEHGLESLGIA
jgi:hypothetical protein